ncbi:hypothetical protein N9Q03_00455 [Flavobacteriaceae bacterium]|jgi:hypothetical protein|nr:hypothetical protein [Flavobacteriaceae bacterium]
MLVFDNENARKDLKKFQLTKQYKKACDYIRDEQYYKVQLKIRKPKSKGVYQFRISKKYRAFAIKKEQTLFVFEISDHQ